jgi:hypothetical protein
MSLAHLAITDGTTAGTVNLIRGPFYLSDYQPGVPKYKGGGVFIDSPLATGRRLAYSVFENATDRFDIMLKEDSGDDADDELNVIVTLFEKAARHWKTNGRTDPVWLELRGPEHTSIKYGKIVVGSVEGLDNPFANPYLQGGCSVLESELILLVERQNWKPVKPGEVEALPIVDNEYQLNLPSDPSLDGYNVETAWAELGSPDSTERSSNQVYDGTHSVRIIDTGSNDGIYQDVDEIDPASTATVTAWAYVNSGTARLQIYDGGGTSNGVSDSTTTTGEWVQLSVDKNVPGSGEIRIALEAVGSDADIYVDHVEVFKTFGPGASDSSSKVYFSNGRSEAHITHVIRFDQPSTYSSNLLEDALPYNLLSSPTTGDIIYFGSTTGHAGGGPFGNVVVNLSSTTDATIVWEYYNGSWTALNPSDGSDEFSVSGRSVTGYPVPADWEANNPGMGVTGYWIRARVSAVAGGGSVAQATFHPYTVAENYVEIDSANLTGDYDPTIRLSLLTESTPVNEAAFEYLTTGAGAADGGDGDSDDAGAGTLVLTNATVNMGQDSTILFRFDDVDVPNGARIKSARIHATSAGGTADGEANYSLHLENVDDSALLTAGETPSARTFLAESVLWSIDAATWATYTGAAFWAPEVTSMVQDVVDRSGWASGNAMTFMLTDQAVASTKYRTFSMYENNALSWHLEVIYVDVESYTSNLIIGARSTNRGADFQSCINLAPFSTNGISVGIGENCRWIEGVSASALGGPLVAFNTIIDVSVSGEDGSLKDRAIVSIPPQVSLSYSGRYRAFVRVSHAGPVDPTSPTSIRLRTSVGGESRFSQVSAAATLQYPELVDLGFISIPEISSVGSERIEIAVQTTRGTSLIHYLYDLVLIPSDEWICEVIAPSSADGVLDSGRTLVIDGIDATSGLRAEMATNIGKVRWAVSGTPARLERNNTVRLWAVSSSDLNIDAGGLSASSASFNNFVHSMQISYVREFLIGRGSL